MGLTGAQTINSNNNSVDKRGGSLEKEEGSGKI
jgi:hypothetical protein